MNTFKVIIAGSRKFTDYALLKEKCDRILSAKLADPNIEVIVVSGHASGADALGERYALEKGLKKEVYPADWKRFGRAAGPVRNAQMADVADALIAFPLSGEENRGTKNMITLAQQRGLLVRIISKQK